MPRRPATIAVRPTRRELALLMGLGAAAGGAGLALPGRGRAQTTGATAATWPDRPVRLVVPFGAGGAIDTLSRTVAQHFPAHANGQPLVVDNRAGAGGTIAAAFVAQQRPDGYTLMMADIGANAVAGEMYRGLSYDPARAFTPIVHLVNLPMALIARPALPARDLADLLAQTRARPDAFTYSSAGSGNASHLFMELLMREAGGLRMVHVPYRSGAEAVGAIIKGEADVSFVSVSSALSFVRAGTVRALAVGAARPVEALPETPTIAATVPGFTANIWHGVLGPAGVPTDLAARANAVFNAIAALPEVQETLRRVQAAEVVGGPPERFGELIRAEIERWTPVVRAAGIRAD